PRPQSDISRYVVSLSKSYLPIQGDARLVASWTNEAHVEKRLRREIGTGDNCRIRRPCNNTRPVELQISNDRCGYKLGRRVCYRPRNRDAAAGVIRRHSIHAALPNYPRPQSDISRYVVCLSKSSLPIQSDGRLVASGTSEAHVEKRLRREIRTGDNCR